MTFYVQYNAATGSINATVNNAPSAPGPLPDGVGQLALDAYAETDGKRVNLDTLTLEDVPVDPPPTI